MTESRPVADEDWPTAEDAAKTCPVPHRAMPLHGPRLQHDPSGLYREMRERYGAISPVELVDGVPAWLVLGYREIQQVAGNGELFSRDPRLWNGWDTIPENWGLLSLVGRVRSVGLIEGDEHRRRARAVSHALEGVEHFELQQLSEQVADWLIDEFATTGSADLMHFAHRLPVRVLAEVLGVLDEVLDDRDVVINAAGSLPEDLNKLWRAREPRQYHVE